MSALSLANQLTYEDASTACPSDILLFFVNDTTWEQVTPTSTYPSYSENSKINRNGCNENNGKPAKQTT